MRFGERWLRTMGGESDLYRQSALTILHGILHVSKSMELMILQENSLEEQVLTGKLLEEEAHRLLGLLSLAWLKESDWASLENTLGLKEASESVHTLMTAFGWPTLSSDSEAETP